MIFIDELFRKVIQYEYIASMREPDFSQIMDDLPPGYSMIFSQSEEAYSIYRQWMIRFVNTHKEMDSIYVELERIMEVLASTNPTLFKAFITGLSGIEVAKYSARRYNSHDIAETISSIGTKEIKINTTSLNYYQSNYEIDEPLTFLESLRKVFYENNIDFKHKELCDRGGRLVKGRIVNSIKKSFKDYPNLSEAIVCSYNSKLRNAIGHNNYKIINGCMLTMNGQHIVDKNQFANMLYKMQLLHNSIQSIISVLSINVSVSEYSDYGVIGVRYVLIDSTIKVVFYQFECFYNAKTGLCDSSKINLKVENNSIRLEIGDIISFEGPINEEIHQWIECVKVNQCLEVVVAAICPFTGGKEKFVQFGEDLYELTGESYSRPFSAVLHG